MPKATKKKTSLRASLAAHQAKVAHETRIKKGHESAYGALANASTVKKSGEKSKGSNDPTIPNNAVKKSKGKSKVKVTIPFKPDHRILLVGEGNFSFTLALINLLPSLSTSLLIATSYDSEEECYEKYPDAKEIVAELRTRGVRVFFRVDGRALGKQKDLKGLVFDTIVFNFPHVGAGIKDQDRNILVNQELLVAFFQAAAPLLSTGADPSPPSYDASKKKSKGKGSASDDEDDEREGVTPPPPDEDEREGTDVQGWPTQKHGPSGQRGSVLVTIRDSAPYTLWNVPRLAKSPPVLKNAGTMPHKYSLVRSFRFDAAAYPGYEHRRTIGGSVRREGDEDESVILKGASRTYEFVVKDKEERVEGEFGQGGLDNGYLSVGKWSLPDRT